MHKGSSKQPGKEYNLSFISFQSHLQYNPFLLQKFQDDILISPSITQ